MAYTGLLILARTQTTLTDLRPLAGVAAELVEQRSDHWQLAAVHGHLDDAPGWANALVRITAAPVLITMIRNSDTALLLGASPTSPAWIAVLNDPSDSAGRTTIPVTTTAQEAVAWAAEAGQTVATETVLEALCATDRDNLGPDRTSTDTTGDADTRDQTVYHQTSHIENDVMRVFAALGFTMSLPAPSSSEGTVPVTDAVVERILGADVEPR